MAHIVPATEYFIREAADRLRNGGVVAFPTETVYGLGAGTFHQEALQLIYQLKGRPSNNPLIAHVLDSDQARGIVEGWDDRCDTLAQRFWPGPLAMVLRKSRRVPMEATAGLNTIAVRAPAHAVARKLLQSFGSPISAPSANRSGCVSPTRTDHVASDFTDVADLLILDGGASSIGIESTVLDMTGDMPRVLRAGGATVEQLRETLGGDKVDLPSVAVQSISPGTSASHYAPRTPAELIDAEKLLSRLETSVEPMAVLCFGPALIPLPHRAIEMPPNAAEYARLLYEAFRQADAMKCSRILIERPPQIDHLWRAVHDRLNRAAEKRQ